MLLWTEKRNRLLLFGLAVGFFLLLCGFFARHTWAENSEPRDYFYEILTGEPLAGAKLHLLDSSGGLVAEIITDGTEIVLEAELIAGETYTLREVEAPPGYVLAEDVIFTVSEDGSIDEIIMKDDYTKVEIFKLDGRDRPLAGALLQLWDKDGNVVEEWISTEEPHKVYAKLVAGETYTLHEEKTPEGYLRADDQTFTVSEDGSIDRLTVYNIRNSTPVTGDDSPAFWLIVVGAADVIFFAVVGIYVAAKRRKEAEETLASSNGI